uniref:Uncharacterized protein n=1 Tax=Sander lucioperca TaxID=283035 RepID=A0A8C9X3D0_SANLU
CTFLLSLYREVCSGAFLAYCYLEAAGSDRTSDQQKPGLKSIAQHFILILTANW